MQLILPEQLTACDKATRYVRDFYNYRHGDYINNISTDLLLLDTGDECFPVSINSGNEKTLLGEKNSYVVSPLTTYVNYARFEIAALGKPWLTWPATALVFLIGIALRLAKVDCLIQINNWLLSTNIYPKDVFSNCEKSLDALKRFFITRYPKHGLGFRSLNDLVNHQTITTLHAAGFVAIPSRQVYLFDGSAGEASPFRQKHNTQIDAKSLAKMSYQLSFGNEFSKADFERCEQLYRRLYIEKYSSLNPQYSAVWLAAGQAHGWLTLLGLRNSTGELEGVVGFFENDEVITAPIFGYNTALPTKEALYRRLTQLCLQRAVNQKKLLNFSSGAASFKRLRGGVPAIEYTMIYVAHLNFYRRWCWKILGYLLHKIAVPIMKRWQL